jgi:class 3 adenylate cyclase
MSTVNCPACGSANPNSPRFCSHCGAVLPGRTAGVEKQAEEEPRKVTVVFSDISGYTAMTEHI